MPNFAEKLTSGQATFELILLCIYAGFLVACGVAIWQRRVMGGYIRALINAGATDRAHALTMEQAGFKKNFFIRRALTGRGLFAGTVYEAAETPEFDREDHALPIYRERFDEEKARFYIPEALKYRAQVRFEKKGTHIMGLVIAAILFGAVVIVALLYKDRIVNEIREWYGMMG